MDKIGKNWGKNNFSQGDFRVFLVILLNINDLIYFKGVIILRIRVKINFPKAIFVIILSNCLNVNILII